MNFFSLRRGGVDARMKGKMRDIMMEAKNISRKDAETQRPRGSADLSTDALWFNGKSKDVLDFDSMIFY